MKISDDRLLEILLYRVLWYFNFTKTVCQMELNNQGCNGCSHPPCFLFKSESTYEPRHGKTNKMEYVPSEDSDQPGHPPSLIRIFAVRTKKAWIHSYSLSATAKTLIRLGECPG